MLLMNLLILLGLKVPNEHPQKKKSNEYSKFRRGIKIANIFYQKQLRESPKAISLFKVKRVIWRNC